MRTIALGWLVVTLACARSPSPSFDAGSSSRKPRVEVTLLATGDEGAVAKSGEVWRAREGHCVDGRCRTLALSTGGHAAGALAQLGYAASALGTAELRQLHTGGALGGLPHLSADVALADAGVADHVVVERAGIRFYVMGLAALPMADGGVDVAGLTATLYRDVVPSWQVAPVAVVVSAACVDVLASILENHARAWPFLVAVVGRACGPTPAPRHIYSVLLVATPDGFDGYARATLSFDQNTAALLRAEGSVVRW